MTPRDRQMTEQFDAIKRRWAKAIGLRHADLGTLDDWPVNEIERLMDNVRRLTKQRDKYMHMVFNNEETQKEIFTDLEAHPFGHD